MKLQTKAVNVLERTSHYLKSGVLGKQPAWFDVIAQNPPNKTFLREPKTINNKQSIELAKPTILPKLNKALYKTRADHTPPRNIYKPQKLRYVEDELRNLFYEQHPWELSRPKILLENSGNDNSKQDWSSIRQINVPLSGESVVQRTIYLLNNVTNEDGDKKTLAEAYDQARFEFYRVRIEEEIEDQVSQEENGLFGAAFTKSPLEHGTDAEQKVIDEWKVKAVELTKVAEARNSGQASNDS